MFLEQIKSSRVSGIVHVCDSLAIGGTVEYLYTKCSICGKFRYDNVHPMANMYAPQFIPPDDEFLQKYKECTGDFRTDEEVAEEMKSLWQRIKGWFK